LLGYLISIGNQEMVKPMLKKERCLEIKKKTLQLLIPARVRVRTFRPAGLDRLRIESPENLHVPAAPSYRRLTV
jgi:hypothetical protein